MIRDNAGLFTKSDAFTYFPVITRNSLALKTVHAIVKDDPCRYPSNLPPNNAFPSVNGLGRVKRGRPGPLVAP